MNKVEVSKRPSSLFMPVSRYLIKAGVLQRILFMTRSKCCVIGLRCPELLNFGMRLPLRYIVIILCDWTNQIIESQKII